MQELRFEGLHEDGHQLVLSAHDGSEYVVPVDDRVRAAVRHRPAEEPRGGPLRPKDVQAMIRAGETTDEVAEATGWPLERVRRFEGPILAERGHVAGLAQSSRVRSHGRSETAPTLESRVLSRLAARGVDVDTVRWDAVRPDGGRWSVLLTFIAGQRDRQAVWRFDTGDRAVEALDDEARWLSEDEQSLPGGGATAQELLGSSAGSSTTEGDADLMSTMRQRSRSRGRRGRKPGTSSAPASAPAQDGPGTEQAELGDQRDPGDIGRDPAGLPGEVLPLEDFPYDPDTMGLPPAAHGRTGQASTSTSDATAAPTTDATTGPEEETDEADGRFARRSRPERAERAPNATLADFFGDEQPSGARTSAPDDPDEDAEAVADTVAGAESPLADLPVDDPDADAESDLSLDSAEPEPEAAEPEPEATEPEPEPETAGRSRRRGRTSVPSWDDIMFGSRDQGKGQGR